MWGNMGAVCVCVLEKGEGFAGKAAGNGQASVVKAQADGRNRFTCNRDENVCVVMLFCYEKYQMPKQCQPGRHAQM